MARDPTRLQKTESLCIKPTNNFRHAGELSARFDTFDPRKPSFDVTQVEIDLRECEFAEHWRFFPFPRNHAHSSSP